MGSGEARRSVTALVPFLLQASFLKPLGFVRGDVNDARWDAGNMNESSVNILGRGVSPAAGGA